MNKKYLLLVLFIFFGVPIHAMEKAVASSSSGKEQCMAIVLYKDPQIKKLKLFGKAFGISVDELTDQLIKSQSCVVCYDDFEPTKEDQHPIMVTFTAHGKTHYHLKCLQDWLKINPNCPTCSTSLADLAPKPASQPEVTQNTAMQNQDETPLAQAKINIKILKEQYFRMKKRALCCFITGAGVGMGILSIILAYQTPPQDSTCVRYCNYFSPPQ